MLNIISNDVVYTNRLAELKEERAKLDKSQHIVSTVALAEMKLEEASEFRQKYLAKLNAANKEIEEVRKNRLEDVVTREAKIKERTLYLNGLEQTVAKRFVELRSSENEIKKQSENFARLRVKYEEATLETEKVRAYFTEKVRALQDIIGK